MKVKGYLHAFGGTDNYYLKRDGRKRLGTFVGRTQEVKKLTTEAVGNFVLKDTKTKKPNLGTL